ncbi:raftlin [Betta splendens]|uniref:Raftlin n=1 Tax=Betta splendens TaxID=158456 RepID=A0A6P7NYJ2_BETSP|nr:raftlin [Betta splendens]
MGCRLPKLRKAEERRSPGNIYSTLRRPQVETKVGVAYTYHFLDFLLGKEEVPVSSVLCLSSVRELPVQVRELYAQGFVLVAVHPFVHPCGPRHAHVQRQLHRAVLIRETPSSEKSQLKWARRRLETDVCVAGHQAADPEVIQSYVKRIQDVAEQGVMFVGFLQQPGGGPSFLGHWDPEELSSLHSSPSPIHRHPVSANVTPTEPHQTSVGPECLFEPLASDDESVEWNTPRHAALEPAQSSENLEGFDEEPLGSTERSGRHRRSGVHTFQPPDAEGGHIHPSPVQQQPGQLPTLLHLPNQDRRASSPESCLSSPDLERSRDDATHNNNHIRLRGPEKASPPARARMQLFALYNHTGELDTSLRFYSLRVPLQVQKEGGLITDIDAHWLDHMTQHFSSGAHLVDGFFYVGEDNGNGVSSEDSVFIFQNSAQETVNASFDAIVVEQWTVVDGVVVKADYIPLLQSLAPYGWRLTCVLPTPIVKTNSDGSLSTKQILFLQRPILQRKRKDFKMPNLRGRSKAKKDSIGEEERESRSPLMETEMDRLRRGATEEAEEGERRRSWDSGRSEGASREEGEAEAPHQTGSSPPPPGSRASAEEREEETDIDRVPRSKREKAVRWTDVCQEDDARAKEEARMEERIKQQLFSGVC